MEDELLVYCEINFICLFILLIILINEMRTNSRGLQYRYFVVAVFSCAGLFASDLVWGIYKQEFITLSTAMCWAVNVVYFLFSVGVGYFWLMYIEVAQKSLIALNKSYRIPFRIMSFIEIILVLASPLFGLIFIIDEAGNYSFGPLYPYHIITSFGFVSFGSIKALVKAFFEKNYAKRYEYFSLSYFAICPIAGLLLQLLIPGTAFTCVGITMSILIIFMRLQCSLISVDALTKLNNRYQYENYISDRFYLYGLRHGVKVYLSIADLDYFKDINDTYGHAAGDEALRIVANALRQGCANTKAFIARFGGDEFIIMCESKDRQLIDSIWENVRAALEEENKNHEFKLSLSVGIAEYGGKEFSPHKFFNEADKALYEEKQRKKALRNGLQVV